MADEKQSTEPTEPTENVEQLQFTEKTEQNTVPSYRLREEATKRRAAEAKLVEYEKADRERNDADLNWKEKHDKVSNEFLQFKETSIRNALNSEFTSKMVEAGMPPKIAKVAIPTDLSEDNMAGKVKDAVKEFAEFIIKADDTPKPNTSFSSVQPGTNKDSKTSKKTMGELAREASNKRN